jgi:hypothetical protein
MKKTRHRGGDFFSAIKKRVFQQNRHEAEAENLFVKDL